LKFLAKDVDTDELVEYQIRDLTQDRFEEAFDIMVNEYFKNEPLNAHVGCATAQTVIDAYRIICQSTVDEKTSVACFKSDTDEIVGVSIVTVLSRDDHVEKQILEFAQCKQVEILFDANGALYGDFDVFKHYNVDNYVGSFGLSVVQKYWGRNIGFKLLKSREPMGKAFGIDIAHSAFSSNFSNPIAEKVGYEVDAEITYEELSKLDSRFDFADIGHHRMTARTWLFD